MRHRAFSGSGFWRTAAPAAFAAAAIVMAGACSVVELNSRWSTTPVLVNGIADDWKGELVSQKDKGFALGVKNDGRFLYVCIVGETPMLRTMALSRGLTVWLDAAGGSSKAFGIKYPLAAADLAPAAQPAPAAGGGRGATGRAQTDVIILGPDKGAEKRIPIRELKGIEVRAAIAQNVFAYELKIPLAASSEFPYGLGAAGGPFVGVGLEIPAVHVGEGVAGGGMGAGGGGEDMGAGAGSMGGGEAGGGLSEGGGGGRGGGGGGMRGGGRGMNGLYFWAKVALAKG
jgi:hypothetical protein